jgi:hypothetical protein
MSTAPLAARIASRHTSRTAAPDFDRVKFYEELEAAGIKNPNKWHVLRVHEMAKKAKFVFRNEAMKALWDDEIRGQITDGMFGGYGTARISDLFWADVPAAVGGSTKVNGVAPSGARTKFQFRDLVNHVGDRMLTTVQQSEPAATMADVEDYLDEMAVAVKGVKKEDIRAPDAAPSSGGAGPASDIDKIRHELQWKLGVKNPKVIAENVMVGRAGRRTQQYHYFVIWQDKATNEFVGANAYGTFGKSPRSVEIARDDDMAKVQRKVQAKIRKKSRDYETKPSLTPNQWRWKWGASASTVADRYLNAQ